MKNLKDKEKTEIILEALKHKYTSWGRCNVLFPELRLGSGYSDIAQRRIDLFMISSEKGNYTTAFEIKVSRGDFLKDIKDNLKQRGARLYASNFYYVAPKDMIKSEEIPVWAGLIEYDFDNKQFATKIPAPLQSRNTPSWSLICSLVRRVNEAVHIDESNDLRALVRSYERELIKATSILKQIANNELDEKLLKIATDEYKTRIILKTGI